ncbi:4929_t:CDS:2, partial [Cetraspora pellucida]
MKYINNSSITSSSKGDIFEIKVFRLVKNKIKIDCQRVRQRTESASWPQGMLQEPNFESVVSRFNKQTTIRIYVISAKDSYSSGAIGRAESSEYHLLLTNIHDLCQDIPEYLSKILKDNSVNEKIYRIKEK